MSRGSKVTITGNLKQGVKFHIGSSSAGLQVPGWDRRSGRVSWGGRKRHRSGVILLSPASNICSEAQSER